MERLGQYKILRKLGAGAMGEVYLAEHQLLKAKRALKVLPKELSASESFRERFLTEGRVLAGLRHPHIVQVHDMGVEDNVHYIAMEFVSPDGRQVWPLDRLLAKSGGSMQPGSAARILLQVCEAIAYAHEQGVIHRDIKPSNVLVVRNNEVCVSDFGLSKVLGQPYLNQSIKASISGSIGLESTQIPQKRTANDSMGSQDTLGGNSYSRAESLVGTYHYMPPELHSGGIWTKQGDIYSIGVLTYVLLTGQLPLGRWKLPSEIISHLESFWDRLVEIAMQTDPARRFPSANAILDFIRKQGHTATAIVTPHSFGKSDDMPLLVRQQVRNFVETHQGRWTETQFLEFQVQLYQNPDHAGISRKAVIEAVETEKNQWLEKEARRKEEEARLAEERRKAAEEAERRHKEANEARRKVEETREEKQEKLRQQELQEALDHVRQRQRDLEAITEELRNIQLRCEKEKPASERRLRMFAGKQQGTESYNQLCLMWKMAMQRYNRVIDDYNEAKAALPEVVTLAKGVILEMVWIPPGTFMMGSPKDETERCDNEELHQVTLTQGFWMGKYPVTQAQWNVFIKSNFSDFKDDDRLPVNHFMWGTCLDFFCKLNAKGAGNFRLPTEAEWEYACRAGTTTPFYFGETISTDQANYDGNSTYGNGHKGVYRGKTTPVGSFPANAWGLYDMHGNIWELCYDSYEYYKDGAQIDPVGSDSGILRVGRGGDWSSPATLCRSAFRSLFLTNIYLPCGFRVVRV